MKRKSTGKRLRFKVFERDSFTCQYCGKKTPEVILHIDHIYPVSKGGKNEIENLITACRDCNLGKSTLELGTSPRKVIKNKDDLEERYEQLKYFYNLQKKMDFLKTEIISDLEDYWYELWESRVTQTGVSSLKRFLKLFSVEEIKEAMDISKSKIKFSEQGFKYMCGVLHTKLKTRKLLENNDDIPFYE